MKKLREKLELYMLRPFIYMTFTRFLLSLCAFLLADFFISPHVGQSLKSPLFVLGGILFAVLAWIAYLRLDGIKLPRIMMMRINPSKKPKRSFGDIIDYVDEKPISFEELDDDEKDICILGADLICCVIFFVSSAFV